MSKPHKNNVVEDFANYTVGIVMVMRIPQALSSNQEEHNKVMVTLSSDPVGDDLDPEAHHTIKWNLSNETTRIYSKNNADIKALPVEGKAVINPPAIDARMTKKRQAEFMHHWGDMGEQLERLGTQANHLLTRELGDDTMFILTISNMGGPVCTLQKLKATETDKGIHQSNLLYAGNPIEDMDDDGAVGGGEMLWIGPVIEPEPLPFMAPLQKDTLFEIACGFVMGVDKILQATGQERSRQNLQLDSVLDIVQDTAKTTQWGDLFKKQASS